MTNNVIKSNARPKTGKANGNEEKEVCIRYNINMFERIIRRIKKKEHKITYVCLFEYP